MADQDTPDVAAPLGQHADLSSGATVAPERAARPAEPASPLVATGSDAATRDAEAASPVIVAGPDAPDPTEAGDSGATAATSRVAGTDPSFVDVVTRRVGGWRGAHEGAEPRDTALLVTLLFASVTWALLALRQLPCRMTLTDAPNAYYRLCYSDIPVLYQSRKLYEGTNPFGLEYPVLTGFLVEISRLIAQVFGGKVSMGQDWATTLHSIHVFSFVTGALLFLCYLGVVACHVVMQPRRRWDAMMIAAAPVVVAAGLVNWDMLCLLCTALALLFWARRRPVLAGVFIGLGVAAKLYTGLLLVPLFALCLRERRIREFAETAAGAALGWGIPNGIVYALYPNEWAYFWTFNQDRGADLGSVWYAAKLAGLTVPDKISLPMELLFVVGVAAIVALGMAAPRRPRVAQLGYLMLVWFLIINKVYSPQYVLWLLPFVVLARPRWRDYLIWTVGELVYFCAIWGHLAQTMIPPGGSQDKLYIASIIVRVGVEVWLGATIVMDIFDPAGDPIRADGTDDPLGGVLCDDTLDAGPDDPERVDRLDAEPDEGDAARPASDAVSV